MTFLKLAADMLSAYDDRFGGEWGVVRDYQEGAFLEDFLIDTPLPSATARDSVLRALQSVLDERFDRGYNERPLPETIKALEADGDRRDFSVSRLDRTLDVPRKLQPALRLS